MKSLIKSILLSACAISLTAHAANAEEFSISPDTTFYGQFWCLYSTTVKVTGLKDDGYGYDNFVVGFLADDGKWNGGWIGAYAIPRPEIGETIEGQNWGVTLWYGGNSGGPNPGETFEVFRPAYIAILDIGLGDGRYEHDFSQYDIKASIPVDIERMRAAGGGCERLANLPERSASNIPPVANAGDDISYGIPYLQVYLDGSQSSDEDGDDLVYTWTQIAGPTVELIDADTATPSFYYPPGRADQVIEFELIVNDGTEDSEPDTVTVIHNGRSNGNANGRK